MPDDADQENSERENMGIFFWLNDERRDTKIISGLIPSCLNCQMP